MTLYGGIEAGGTKFVCAVGGGPDDIRDEIRFPTTTPEETISQAVNFFRAHHTREPLAAVGIASFGPVDPDPTSPTWGYITTTPKPGWRRPIWQAPCDERWTSPSASTLTSTARPWASSAGARPRGWMTSST